MVQDFYIRIPDFVRMFVKNLDDSPVTDQVRKLLFFFFSSFMMMGALSWGFVCLVYGYRMPSLIPFTYVIITLFNFVLSGSKTKYADAACIVQIAMSIFLPFIFQYALGGIANSGMVMIWALLALLGSMIIQNKKLTILWVSLFLVLTIGSFLMEPRLATENSIYSIPIILTAFNLILVTLFVYMFGQYFVGIQNKLRGALAHQKEQLIHFNDQVNGDLVIAKGFQDILLDQDTSSIDFFHSFEVKINTSPVTGNFMWTGKLTQKQVLVFVDNPHTGVRGSMESMLIWNLIDSAVYRLRMQNPKEIVEYIQREIYDRFITEEMKSGVSEIGVAVVYKDNVTGEMSYAIVDTTVVLSGIDSCKVLKGFKEQPLGSEISSSGSVLVQGKLLLDSRSKITFVNAETMRILGISDDDGLVEEESPLKKLFMPENRIAEKNVRHILRKAEKQSDVFLTSVEF